MNISKNRFFASTVIIAGVMLIASCSAGGSSFEESAQEGSSVSTRDVNLSVLTRIPDFYPRDPYDLEEPNRTTYIDYINFEQISELENSYSEAQQENKNRFLQEVIEEGVGIPYGFSDELEQLVVADTRNIFGRIDLSFLVGNFDTDTIRGQLQENGYEEESFADRTMWTQEEHPSVSFYDEGLVVGSRGLMRDFLMAEAGEAGTLFEKFPQYRKLVSHYDSNDLQAHISANTMKPPRGGRLVARNDTYSYNHYKFMDHPSEAGRFAREYEDDEADNQEFEYSELESDSDGSLFIARFTGVQIDQIDTLNN